MKKTLLSILMLFCATFASAQEIVLGDMDGDGKVTVVDVTEVVSTVTGKSAIKKISGNTLVNPNAPDTELLAGAWRSITGEKINLNADGTATHSNMQTVKTYEYYPYGRMLVLLNSGGYVVEVYDVIRTSENFVVMCVHGTNNYVCYYSNDSYASGITLSSTNLALNTGETKQLSATATPPNSITPLLTWSSNNTSVATVDKNGKVTGVNKGSCVITVSDGYGVSAVCKVIVSLPQNNGHEYVDLGLPSGLKWATCNVGASKPEEYGDYFAWGETEPYYTEGHSQDSPCSNWRTNKTGYNWESYNWCNGEDYSQTKYCTVDNKKVLDLEDDAAHVNWGGEWRMPTKEEQDELRTKCTWTWDSQNGVNGYNVVGPNGTSLFLPAAGYRGNGDLYNVGSSGYYWSSSLRSGYSSYAYYLYFFSDSVDWSASSRCRGLTVRPVCP